MTGANVVIYYIDPEKLNLNTVDEKRLITLSSSISDLFNPKLINLVKTH